MPSVRVCAVVGSSVVALWVVAFWVVCSVSYSCVVCVVAGFSDCLLRVVRGGVVVGLVVVTAANKVIDYLEQKSPNFPRTTRYYFMSQHLLSVIHCGE